MSGVLDELPAGSRVLIIRLRSLGDCVLSTPALALLNQARPDLKISVVVEDRFAPIYEGNPAVDDLLPPQWQRATAARAPLCLNLHGGTRSTVLTAVSLASHRAGFVHFRQQWVYNVHIPRAQEILGEERVVHTAEHAASAMFFLGVPRREIPRAQLFSPPSRRPVSEPYCVIHPFASAPEKAWPAAKFLEVARALPVKPVFIGGPSDDLTPFAAFDTHAGAPLRQIKSLLKDASFFLGNDSGPAHMAAAFGRPVVVLFGASDPVIWAPWKTKAEVITADGPLREVPVRRVLDALERLKVRT